jgi:hypothetical protein
LSDFRRAESAISLGCDTTSLLSLLISTKHIFVIMNFVGGDDRDDDGGGGENADGDSQFVLDM